MSRACVLYDSNKVHARYMRVEDALNAFGTHSSPERQCTLHARSKFTRDCFSNVPKACMRRALNVCCVPIERA